MDKELLQVLLRDLVLPIMALVLVPLITAVLSALARRALALVEQKFGFEVTERQRVALDQLISEAVMYAEEQGRKRLLGEKDTMSGAEKMRLALAHVRGRGQQLGLTSMVEGFDEAVQEAIEAKLFASRIGSSPVKDGGAPQTVKETPADVRPLDDGPKLLTEDGGQGGKAQEDA
jgi:hypothetical protein